jgi:lipoate-protein ligase A
MRLLDLTLSTPAENLALDEALLDWAEETAEARRWESPFATAPPAAGYGETLRVWEPATPFVVLGRASRVEQEVDLEACQRLGIPVLRRASGGAAVVVGPGCLLYAVVLSYELRPELRPLDAAHRFVLGRVAEALAESVPRVVRAGTSDLVIASTEEVASFAGAHHARHAAMHDERKDALYKFSGNSLRCKRAHFLYHGTLIYDFDLRLIDSCLRMPPRQPEYRAGRSHKRFLANLPIAPDVLRRALVQAWQADEPITEWPQLRTSLIARDRYENEDWTWRPRE